MTFRISLSDAAAHPHGLNVWCGACGRGSSIAKTIVDAAAAKHPAASLTDFEEMLRCECGAKGEATAMLAAPDVTKPR